MRQIYTSARNENIDRVVALLREAGIETSVTNRSNYAGHDYKGPSYAAKPNREAWAQVWVVHSSDQQRARSARPERSPPGRTLQRCKCLGIVGSPGRIRTSDQPVNSRLLYH